MVSEFVEHSLELREWHGIESEIVLALECLPVVRYQLPQRVQVPRTPRILLWRDSLQVLRSVVRRHAVQVVHHISIRYRTHPRQMDCMGGKDGSVIPQCVFKLQVPLFSFRVVQYFTVLTRGWGSTDVDPYSIVEDFVGFQCVVGHVEASAILALSGHKSCCFSHFNNDLLVTKMAGASRSRGSTPVWPFGYLSISAAKLQKHNGTVVLSVPLLSNPIK